jgi:O-antigen ligase
MPPWLGAFVFAAMGLVLLRWSSEDANESRALWVPVLWLFIVGSKLPSQWLGLNPMSLTTAFEQGSPVDRIIYFSLIIAGLSIVYSRRLNWGELLARNSALLLLILFALVSVIWSDFTYVAFKRWFRDLGLYLIILVVLSDSRPEIAFSTVIRRLSYIVLFSSMILIKYYPDIGINYDYWTGAPEYQGATTSKNMLGAVCLLSGMFFFWDTLARWSQRKIPAVKRVLFANIVMFAITIRLLSQSNSATSRGCLVIGCVVIALLRSQWARAKPRQVAAAIPAVLVAYAVLEGLFDLSSIVAEFLGRDATLHGRTGIWDAVLTLQTNPLLGVGYQSFWMGDRIAAVARIVGTANLNEAHNGYLETYLNLGVVGVVLLLLFMIASYRTVCRRFTVSPHLGSFGVALWMVMVFYNFTEAAFGTSILWCALLLLVVVLPRPNELRIREMQQVDERRLRSRLPSTILVPAGQLRSAPYPSGSRNADTDQVRL